MALDPNVHIQEVKAVDVRHPAGPAPARQALTEFIADAARAGVEDAQRACATA